jgi:hypothetical protein
MVLSNDSELANRMARLRSHGITRDPAEMTHQPDGPWYYQQIELGYNYRMTELHAALGLSQMERLDAYVDRRHVIADRYDAELARLPLSLPARLSDRRSGLHLYIVRLKRDLIRRSHREVFDALREQGIGVNLHYIPVHLQPWYSRMGFKQGDFPEAERYYAEAISLPIFPALTDQSRATSSQRSRTPWRHEDCGDSGARWQQADSAQEHQAVLRQAHGCVVDRGCPGQRVLRSHHRFDRRRRGGCRSHRCWRRSAVPAA